GEYMSIASKINQTNIDSDENSIESTTSSDVEDENNNGVCVFEPVILDSDVETSAHKTNQSSERITRAAVVNYIMSLFGNGLCWALINEIAPAAHQDKIEFIEFTKRCTAPGKHW